MDNYVVNNTAMDKLAHFASLINVFILTVLSVFFLNNWTWAQDDTLASLYKLLTKATVLGLVAIVCYSKVSKRRYIGASLALSGLGILFIAVQLLASSPIPRGIETVTKETPPQAAAATPQRRRSWTALETAQRPIPYQFWGYGLLIPQNLAESTRVHLPYEKGPPSKLLSKIILVDDQTMAFIGELHGERPRNYPTHIIELIFGSTNGDNSIDLSRMLTFLPEIIRLQKEAGLSTGTRHVLTRTLVKHQNSDGVTELIGTPITGDDQGELRAVLRSSEGRIHQVRVADPRYIELFTTAVVAPVLASMRSETKILAAEQLHGELNALLQLDKKKDSEDSTPLKEQLRNRVILRLVSLLTIDPRDPEAYFHLGKLTPDRETLHSALRYGRDVGLHPAKLAELQSRFDNF